jgi:hypothetical protein
MILWTVFLFFFSDWNVLLYLWSHVPYRYWNNLSIHTVRTAGKSHSHILTHGKNYAYIKSTLWNFWIWDSLICLSAWCSNSRRANIFFCIHVSFQTAPAPTLSAVHVPMIVSCKQKNMAILFFTRQFITLQPHFSTSARKIFQLSFTVFDSLWSFYKRFNYKHYKHHSARL